MKKIKENIKIIIILAIVLTLFLLFIFLKDRNSKKNEFSGIVEATIYDMGFEVPGTIDKIYIKEGDYIKKGTLLASLDDKEYLAAVSTAQATLEKSKASLDDLIAGARPEEISQARAQLNSAIADYKRLKRGPRIEEINQAKALMESAKQRYIMTMEGFRKEDILSAKSALIGAKSNLKTTRDDYNRYKNLYTQGAASAQAYEIKKNLYEQAKANYLQIKENYKKLNKGKRLQERKSTYEQYKAQKASYENILAGTRIELILKARNNVNYWKEQVTLLEKGPRKNRVKMAKKQVKKAKSLLKSAKIKLSKTKLYSPVDGYIITKNFEVKESVGSGTPVISIGDLKNPWVYIFVPEPEIGKIKLGDNANISADSFANKSFKGKVYRIYEKAEYTPKNIQTKRERVNLVFRVKVSVQNKSLDLKPGMPVDVEILDYGKR